MESTQKPVNRIQDRTRRATLFLAGLAASGVLGGTAAFLVPAGWPRAAALAVAVCLYGVLSRRFMLVREARLPVAVFHSISDAPDWMIDTHLALPTRAFAAMLDWLKRRGYATPRVDAVLEHLSGEAPLERGNIVLTIDDGFRDAWCCAAPLLAERGFSGILFMPTDFAEEGEKLRPTMADVRSGCCSLGELDACGYVNWAELAALETRGVLEIEGHTASHTWLEVGERAVDFHRPDDKRLHVVWNAFPEDKSRWHEKWAERTARLWGRPLFETARSHKVRRAFLPDPAPGFALNQAVCAAGGSKFFARPDWRGRLEELVPATAPAGRWEDDAEAEARLDREYAGAKEVLESRLGKRVRILCWPGDEYDEELEARALSSGYAVTTWTGSYNLPGADPRRLHRFYVPFVHPGKGPQWLSVLSFKLGLLLYEGNYYCLFAYAPLCAVIRFLNARRN